MCVCTVMSPLSLEGPYISLFSLLRESSPSLPHPSLLLLLFFCLSPLDPANPPTRPFSMYTVAKGLLQMLEGLFFGRGFNHVWHEFPVLNNADISTPHKKNSFCFFALNLFFHLSHSSIWHVFPLFIFLSPPHALKLSLPPKKIPFIPFSSYPEFTFLISLQPLDSIPPSSVLPPPSPPSLSCFVFQFF